MTGIVFIAMALFAATFSELLLSSFGVSLPLVAVLCFYLAVAQGPLAASACAIVGGASLDFLLGRDDPWSIALLLLVVGIAQFWLYRLEATSLLLLCVPGAVLPFIVIAPWSLPAWTPSWIWVAEFFNSLSGSLLASACSAVLLPLAAWGLDLIAGSLELSLFADAKERLADAQ